MALYYRVPRKDDVDGTEPADFYKVDDLGPDELNVSNEFRCLVWFETLNETVNAY